MKSILLLSISFLFASLLSCQQAPTHAEISQQNYEIAARYFTELYNQDNYALVEELFVEDLVITNTEGRLIEGRDKIEPLVKRIKSMLPNLKLSILEYAADTDKVMFLINMHADMPEFASSNTEAKELSFNETFIFWVKDQKIYKGRTSGAHLTLIKQASGFQGSMIEIIDVLSKVEGSGVVED